MSEVTLDRRCFGCAREGLISLKRDGVATRTIAGNARSGTRDEQAMAALPAGAFDDLARAVVSEGFFQLRDDYRDPRIADGESVTITVTAAGRQKSVLDRNAAGPPPLRRLESRLDALASGLIWHTVAR